MATSFQIRLVTPQGKLLDDQATYASIPAHDGQIAFAPGRAPIVLKLGMGPMTVTFPAGAKGGGGSRSYLVEDGFAQMVSDKLTVLTSRAIPAEELEQAEASKELAAADAQRTSTLDDTLRVTRDRDRARLKLRMIQARGGRGI